MNKLNVTFQFTKDGRNPLAAAASKVGDEDTELVEGGKLWNFLETAAQYEGNLQTLYASAGPYAYKGHRTL